MLCWKRLSCSRCCWLSEPLRGHPLKRRPFEPQDKQDRRTPHDVAVEWRLVAVLRGALGRFGMLLDVGLFVQNIISRRLFLAVILLAVCAVALRAAPQAPQQSSAAPAGQQSPASPNAAPTAGAPAVAPA